MITIRSSNRGCRRTSKKAVFRMRSGLGLFDLLPLPETIFLGAVMHLVAAIHLPPGEDAVGVRNLDAALGNELIAKHHNDVLDRRVLVVLLGHSIDGDFAAFFGHAVFEMHNDDFFVARDPMIVGPENLTLVFKLAHHFESPPY